MNLSFKMCAGMFVLAIGTASVARSETRPSPAPPKASDCAAFDEKMYQDFKKIFLKVAPAAGLKEAHQAMIKKLNAVLDSNSDLRNLIQEDKVGQNERKIREILNKEKLSAPLNTPLEGRTWCEYYQGKFQIRTHSRNILYPVTYRDEKLTVAPINFVTDYDVQKRQGTRSFLNLDHDANLVTEANIEKNRGGDTHLMPHLMAKHYPNCAQSQAAAGGSVEAVPASDGAKPARD